MAVTNNPNFRAVPVDPAQVVIYLGGILAGGFADGEFYNIEQLSPAFVDDVGTDGEVARWKTNDRRAKVTLKLIQTSKINAALSARLQTDLNSPNGLGIGSFQMQDLNGATLVQASQAWIVKYPDGPWDRKAVAREWEIRLANAVRFEGGD
jgi:hypothetical protein